MKKFLAIFAVLMLFLLAACGSEAPASAPVEEPADARTEVVPEEPAEQTEEVSEEPAEQTEEVPEEPAEQEEAPAPQVTEEVPAGSAVDLTAVAGAMTAQLGIADSFPLDTAALMNLYGIGADSVRQTGGFVTMSGTFPDEIVMVEAVDAAAADTVQACLQTRLDAVLVQSQTYDAENYAAAQACSVRRNGLFVCLILSPKEAELAAVYANYIS